MSISIIEYPISSSKNMKGKSVLKTILSSYLVTVAKSAEAPGMSSDSTSCCLAVHQRRNSSSFTSRKFGILDLNPKRVFKLLLHSKCLHFLFSQFNADMQYLHIVLMNVGTGLHL